MNEQNVLTVLLILAIAIVLVVLRIQRSLKSKRYYQNQIENQFGQIPDMEREIDWSRIRVYRKTQKGREVDEITWSDLSMNLIFCRINQCSSAAGEEILYDLLHDTGQSAEKREAFGRLIRYYQDNEDRRKKAQYKLIKMGKKEAVYYIPEYIRTLTVSHIGSLFLYRLLQIGMAAGILLMPLNPQFGMVSAAIALFNLSFYAVMKMKHEQELNMMDLMVLIMGIGNELVKEQCTGEKQQEFEEMLGGFQKFGKRAGNVGAMRAASRTSEHGMLLDYLLGITLWQLTSYEKNICWLEENQDRYMQLYVQIGLLDAAISVAAFRKSLPFYCEPSFSGSKTHRMEMEEIYHPLLADPVCNSMEWERNCIVTGSNASGKSTFIKTVAVNTILAQTVCTCTAKRFEMFPAAVMTSMAVRDDIMSGDSYFIREMKYLKRMIEALSEERAALCIIDEILRGTNTKERIASSKAILDYLERQNCLVMVASHDFELTVLMEGIYDNYHFTEQIKEDDIYFDYKLHSGAVSSGNAIRLLEFMKFPEEIVREAENVAER